jgi:hypothetical protein
MLDAVGVTRGVRIIIEKPSGRTCGLGPVFWLLISEIYTSNATSTCQSPAMMSSTALRQWVLLALRGTRVHPACADRCGGCSDGN